MLAWMTVFLECVKGLPSGLHLTVCSPLHTRTAGDFWCWCLWAATYSKEGICISLAEICGYRIYTGGLPGALPWQLPFQAERLKRVHLLYFCQRSLVPRYGGVAWLWGASVTYVTQVGLNFLSGFFFVFFFFFLRKKALIWEWKLVHSILIWGKFLSCNF